MNLPYKRSSSFLGQVRRRLFSLARDEATFARRGFHAHAPTVRERLETIGFTFLDGYHAALEEDQAGGLAQRLNQVEPELQGFAYEGAAMALALLDFLTPWQPKRWLAFVHGPADAHLYMAHVGLGWALARLPLPVEPTLARLDPVLRWLVVDGLGFHEGYFNWRRTIERQAVPGRIVGYARRVFDQGLGRSLWFVAGADIDRIAATITAFLPSRRADMWSGVGLACAYAGGVDYAAIEALAAAGRAYRTCLAQGAAFAAKARQRAGLIPPHTELACAVLCGVPAPTAAYVTEVALEALPAYGAVPSYEVWRSRIGATLTYEAVAP